MTFQPTERQYEALKLYEKHPLNLLLAGGSRSGKTSLHNIVIIATALKYEGCRQLITRQHLSELVPSIIEDTFPKMCKLIDPDLKLKINRKYMFARLPNDSEIWFAGMANHDSAEKALGNEYCRIYINEAVQLSFETFEKLKTRLAQNIPNFTNQIVLDCNPTHTMHWIHDLFIKNIHPESRLDLNSKDYLHLVMNPVHNRINLPSGYIENTLDNLSAAKRLRFLEGEWANEIEGALWKISYIQRGKEPPELERIVIGVDPAVSSKKTSDETGIIVCGLKDKQGYVLADRSGRYTPNQWAQIVNKLYDEFKADRIVCEINQGGDLVEQTLRNVNRNLPITKVRASRGKNIRAEPIVALYEQKRISHTQHFKELENQMVGWVPTDNTMSPDRLDALVWALYDLMKNKTRAFTYVV